MFFMSTELSDECYRNHNYLLFIDESCYLIGQKTGKPSFKQPIYTAVAYCYGFFSEKEAMPLFLSNIFKTKKDLTSPINADVRCNVGKLSYVWLWHSQHLLASVNCNIYIIMGDNRMNCEGTSFYFTTTVHFGGGGRGSWFVTKPYLGVHRFSQNNGAVIN